MLRHDQSRFSIAALWLIDQFPQWSHVEHQLLKSIYSFDAVQSKEVLERRTLFNSYSYVQKKQAHNTIKP